MTKLSRKLSIRPPVLSTAQTYLRRYLLTTPLHTTSPFLLLSTCLYLASKTDEHPQHIRHVVSEARNFWPDLMTADTARLGECEFSVIAEMRAQLVLHHPYRELLALRDRLALTADDIGAAWWVVNDSYLTDLALLYAPHVIALAAVSLPLVLRGGGGALGPAGQAGGGGTVPGLTKAQRLVNYLAESEVEIEDVADAVQELISLYEVWEGYSDKACKEALTRIVRARALDK